MTHAGRVLFKKETMLRLIYTIWTRGEDKRHLKYQTNFSHSPDYIKFSRSLNLRQIFLGMKLQVMVHKLEPNHAA